MALVVHSVDLHLVDLHLVDLPLVDLQLVDLQLVDLQLAEYRQVAALAVVGLLASQAQEVSALELDPTSALCTHQDISVPVPSARLQLDLEASSVPPADLDSTATAAV